MPVQATNDVAALVQEMVASRDFTEFVNDPELQFGSEDRPYIGPTILPERTVTANQFTEEQVSYRTIVANDGTRYGAAQKKGEDIVGEVDVKLAEQDLSRDFNGQQYDAWRRILRNGGGVFGAVGSGADASMQAVLQLTRWVDRTLIRGMLDKQEKQRWEALVLGSVPLRGHNSYRDSMTYPNPSGHRSVASAPFSDDTVDPFDLMVAQKLFLASKGYRLMRIIWSTKASVQFASNAKVKARAGGAVLNTSGNIVGVSGIVDQARLASMFGAAGLPAPETYDLQYNTSTGSARFLQEDAVVFLASTEREEQVLGDYGNSLRIISNVIGYHAIGVAVGQDTPGRVVNVEAYTKKPPHIEGEIFQTSAPVILEPEAFTVVTGCTS